MLLLILVFMERGDPQLYYGSIKMYLGGFIFKLTGSGNPPLVRLKKKKKKNGGGLLKRGLTMDSFSISRVSSYYKATRMNIGSG